MQRQREAEALAAHFDGLEHTLLTGRTIKWGIDLAKVFEMSHGVDVAAGHLSRYGVRTLQDAVEMTEAGLRLYRHLKSGPAFRYARVCLEPATIPMLELNDYVDDLGKAGRQLLIKCAVDEQLYRELGSPISFYPFREGYWWNRYQGERYMPLYSQDHGELNELCRDLFPEYFRY
ncbi:MAG TPA: hypothetical protein VFC63_28780 [Blastocatellia bacterium]|nr:hypothetical protein [Blastocatellia bacterium]